MMDTTVQELPSSRDSNVPNKDTGFPEPLSTERNTTLPHPDADTSKNAIIEAPDIELTRTRSRLSFIRHARKHSKGSSLDIPAELYENTDYADVTKLPTEDEHRQDTGSPTDDALPPKTVEEFIEKEDRDEQGYTPGQRKKGVLRKLNLHKA